MVDEKNTIAGRNKTVSSGPDEVKRWPHQEGGEAMQATDTWPVPGRENKALPRALLIEDNPVDADIVKRTLGDAGVAAVKTARTAEDGLRMFRQAKWELVLLDYRLPGSSGLDALALLRQIDPDVPTIVLTGVGDDQVAADAIRLGADEYLSKDTIRTVLPTAVRTFLEVKRADARQPRSPQGDRAAGGTEKGDRGGKTASPESACRFCRLWQGALGK